MSDYDKAFKAVVDAVGCNRRGWETTSGPETGVGVEFYFTHNKHGTYYVCVDQGEVTACECQSSQE